MAVIYKPATVKAYYEAVERVRKAQETYDAITNVGEAEAFYEANWEDLKAHVEPPPLNALILDEFMASQRKAREDLIDALGCFWNASIGAAHREQDSTCFAVIGCFNEGLSAVQNRLREINDEDQAQQRDRQGTALPQTDT